MRTATVLALAATMGMTMSTAAFAQSRDFDLTGFDRVDIATGLDARVTLGDSFSVSAQSRSQDALDNLRLTVEDGVLQARFEQSFLDFIIRGGLVGMLLSSGNAVTVDITLPALAGVSASSGADVDLPGIRADQLDLDASSGADISASDAVLGHVKIASSSGADIELSGTAETVDAEASSGAGIDAEDLVASTVTVAASSGASLSVHATASLRAEASSGGDIGVSGNPATREVDESSGGDVNFDD
ncbi:head GIN domain-containing protein [Devosia sp.]|uniref:head GIN domain-containing protein n=1 Tax=Devosia sp. TaxID=1871048 RepID=UPI002FC7E058